MSNQFLSNLKAELLKPRTLFVIFCILPLAVFTKIMLHGGVTSANANNYYIFKYHVLHTIDQLPLYLSYAEYDDHTHYGPFFGAFFAPFATMPNWLGLLSWLLFNSLFLYFAITKLPFDKKHQAIALWIIAHELLTSLFGLQINGFIAGIIILSYVLIKEEKDFWAAALIIVGTFIKLYGILGLAFFFFSKHKPKLILSGLFWAAIAFVLPMLLSSPEFILQSYLDWFERLGIKNALNAISPMQDISLPGMIRRITGNSEISNLPFVTVGAILFLLPYLRIKHYGNSFYRMLLLSSALIFPVIFSSGSESPTYVIAFAGVAIWYVSQPKPIAWWINLLLVFAIVLTSFSPSDLFPRFIRVEYIQPYKLKALPCVLIWVAVIWQMLTHPFERKAHYNYIKVST